MADFGRKARREAAHGAKADKPKDTSRRIDYRIREQTAEHLLRARRRRIRARLRSRYPARMLVPRVGRGMPPRQNGAKHMNSTAATLVIRERLRQRLRPQREPGRREGEYAGGCLCDGCCERITSAQASYEVDFAPGVTPQSVKLHRACFDIWLYECQSHPLPNVLDAGVGAAESAPLNAPASTPPSA